MLCEERLSFNTLKLTIKYAMLSLSCMLVKYCQYNYISFTNLNFRSFHDTGYCLREGSHLLTRNKRIV